MQPKLFRTSLAEYVQAEWRGTNESGWCPLGNRVVVKPDEVATRTKGGIELPQDLQDRMSMAAEAGVVIAVGDGAFKWNSDGITPFQGRAPKPGDRVSIGRYSGQLVMGHDGQAYRIMDSTELGAIQS